MVEHLNGETSDENEEDEDEDSEAESNGDNCSVHSTTASRSNQSRMYTHCVVSSIAKSCGRFKICRRQKLDFCCLISPSVCRT